MSPPRKVYGRLNQIGRQAVTEITDSWRFDGKGNTTQWITKSSIVGVVGNVAVTSVIFSSSPGRNHTRLGA